LITAGGENVAPVLIENEIKEALKVVSNAMVVGDAMKYLTVLLTLKYDVGKDGS
jgi:long-chain-fatty-acid--CoA ligase ACSBG